MRDLLVRYLLGELDAQERGVVDDELQRSPEMQRELAYIRRCLSAPPCDDMPVGEPPIGLAERTVEWIADGASCGRAISTGRLTACSTIDASSGAAPSWSFVDITVAAGVFLAVSMLFLPALRQSRDAARREDCANNLRQLGTSMTQFSIAHGGYFPVIHGNDNAGVYAIYLLDEGYNREDELSRLLVCRSSPLAAEIAAGRVVFRVPSLVEYQAAGRGMGPSELIQRAGGTYAFPLGFVEGNRFHGGIRNECSSHKVLMADSPNIQSVDFRSTNHGGYGQNVLFQCGGVRYLQSCLLPEGNDHLFLNSDGVPAAGNGANDTVLGDSRTQPGVALPESVPVIE